MYIDKIADEVSVLSDFYEPANGDDAYNLSDDEYDAYDGYYSDSMPPKMKRAAAKEILGLVTKCPTRHILAITAPEQSWVDPILVRQGFREVVSFMGSHGYPLKFYIKTRKKAVTGKVSKYNVVYDDEFPTCCGASIVDKESMEQSIDSSDLDVNQLVVAVLPVNQELHEKARNFGFKKIRNAPVWFKAAHPVKPKKTK